MEVQKYNFEKLVVKKIISKNMKVSKCDYPVSVLNMNPSILNPSLLTSPLNPTSLNLSSLRILSVRIFDLDQTFTHIVLKGLVDLGSTILPKQFAHDDNFWGNNLYAG